MLDEKGLLKNFAKLAGKRDFIKIACCRPATLLKRDSSIGIFQQILQSVQEFLGTAVSHLQD